MQRFSRCHPLPGSESGLRIERKQRTECGLCKRARERTADRERVRAQGPGEGLESEAQLLPRSSVLTQTHSSAMSSIEKGQGALHHIVESDNQSAMYVLSYFDSQPPFYERHAADMFVRVGENNEEADAVGGHGNRYVPSSPAGYDSL